MKKMASLLVLLFATSCIRGQNNAAGFEKVILSGNSDKAFDFVRNMFGVPAITEPFLHFKERGIKQLVSFYEHRDKRIEATSLIKFNQTKEFWKNYSEQFTAGKWNYKSLYKTDSLAWQAANYSITLIYAHEMGHYMSYNLINDFAEDYTCEEVVANECLAAFANAFNGNKKMDMHKRLFLSLVKQTAALVPDSAKTDFYIPMDKWCAPSPMNSFFDYYEKDEMRFLRLYGYIQFRMMEQTLSNYNGIPLNDFLQKTFFSNYNTNTGKEHFKPLRYKVISTKNYSNLSDCRVRFSNVATINGTYFYPYILNNFRYYLDNKGSIFDSYIDEKTFYNSDTLDPSSYARYSLINEEQKVNTSYVRQQLSYMDSLSSTHPSGKSISADFDIQAVHIDSTATNYLVRKNYFFRTDNSLELDSLQREYEFLHLFKEDSDYYFRRFLLPDSFYNNKKMSSQEILLGRINTGIPVIITNELTENNTQIITLYPVNKNEARLEPAIWQGTIGSKGYFNMLYTDLFYDEVTSTITIAFWNPVTSKICLLKIKEGSTEGYELYSQTLQGKYGPSLRVNAMRFTAGNKLQVLAETRQPGNKTKPIMQHMLIQW